MESNDLSNVEVNEGFSISEETWENIIDETDQSAEEGKMTNENIEMASESFDDDLEFCFTTTEAENVIASDSNIHNVKTESTKQKVNSLKYMKELNEQLLLLMKTNKDSNLENNIREVEKSSTSSNIVLI